MNVGSGNVTEIEIESDNVKFFLIKCLKNSM